MDFSQSGPATMVNALFYTNISLLFILAGYSHQDP